ncbi:hypothetical protein, partial [Anaerorhabdus sp.]|uniref:hypothetical protein n=1 Tax=Anaerorhabdus sp. TaxID=1872524 RepID=UPI002FC9826A
MKTISYSNRLYLNELESQIIQQDIHLYHQMLIRSYRLIYHKNYNGLQIDSLQKKVKLQRNMKCIIEECAMKQKDCILE